MNTEQRIERMERSVATLQTVVLFLLVVVVGSACKLIIIPALPPVLPRPVEPAT